jgi:enoyl-CoA hydratase/carnithine racemase
MTEPTASQPVVLFDMLTPHIAVVTLNRPEKRNAINGDVAQAIEAIVKKIEADPEVRAVILTSSDDRVFCAGADLASVAGGTGAALETAHGGFAGLVYAQRTKPWIVAVEGLAVAGGFEIVLACDMIVASRKARFGLPEVKRGMMAAGGGIHRLPNRIPASIAYELIATGDTIDAERAFACGLLNRLAEEGETLSAAQALAEQIAPNAPLAVQFSLSVARTAPALPDGAGRNMVGEWFAQLRKTEDYKEGPRAFVEKRDPVWKGR